jgi:hypothetical protein
MADQPYCTRPGEHRHPGQHDRTCVPLANPSSPELRMIRSLYGLCPYCDSDELGHAHTDVPELGDTADYPAVQARRDALMPWACGVCGGETLGPGEEPEHLPDCPASPDAVADAKAILHERILNRAGPRDQDATEQLLEDLIALAEDSLDLRGRAELVARVLAGRRPVRWEVAFGPVTVTDAVSAEAAAAMAAAEDQFERDDKYYQGDPNPAVWVRRAGSQDPWQQVYEDPAAIEAARTAIEAEQ